MADEYSMPLTLGDWQRMFERIYGDVNRQVREIDLWLHLTEEASEIARDMRKEDYGSLSKDLPDLFAWLCAFASRKRITLEDALWKKYPGICPYCRQDYHCVCIAETNRPEFDSRMLVNYHSSGEKPKTFEEWNQMFRNVYGNVNRVLSRSAIGFHLIEEVGEVARTIRGGTPDNYALEIADVFAWILAIPMKITELGPLDKMTWDLYRNRCKRCYESPCICYSHS